MILRGKLKARVDVYKRQDLDSREDALIFNRVVGLKDGWAKINK